MSKSVVHAVSLTILGKEYKIACAEDEREALIAAAQALDGQMRKIRDTGKVGSADRIAVLAALNLAHDAPTKSGGETADIGDRIRALRQKIENVLESP
ncbi:MAG: cell division protein ZapA [Methylomonas sp.]|nr:cell division protein ZapA [Methylomonas sp.]PPD21023.1 MAG: cell division protein ZapA [Methylomonas sp.]PPD27050.1 MAG: cell division protein ZapA [Methylomonas sp.]PPD38982.1 MAG: cell division protein ZapA [Methylomonas sp.]PPD40897.1 MAG: cell division protein ZapA [Methylomonas sp.]